MKSLLADHLRQVTPRVRPREFPVLPLSLLGLGVTLLCLAL
jgi:hypothetical protein